MTQPSHEQEDACTCANRPRFGSPTAGKGVVGWTCKLHGPMRYRDERPVTASSQQARALHELADRIAADPRPANVVDVFDIDELAAAYRAAADEYRQRVEALESAMRCEVEFMRRNCYVPSDNFTETLEGRR